MIKTNTYFEHNRDERKSHHAIKVCVDCGCKRRGRAEVLRCRQCEGTRRQLYFRHSDRVKKKISKARYRGGTTKYYCACGKQVCWKTRKCRACARLKGFTGENINGIILLGFIKVKNSASVWSARCRCGNIFEVAASRLRSKHVRSCGCLLKEHLAKLGLRQSGVNSPVWVKDRSKVSRALRRASGASSRLATTVKLERGLKCAISGKVCQSTRELHAHHIEPVGVNPSRGKDKTNISVVLVALHKEFHRRFGMKGSANDWHYFVNEKQCSQ